MNRREFMQLAGIGVLALFTRRATHSTRSRAARCGIFSVRNRADVRTGG